MPSFQPQTFGFMGAIAHVLERTTQTRTVDHQAEGAMPIHPAITVALAPGCLLVQSTQSFWENALCCLRRGPARAASFVHPLIATDHAHRGPLEERFETRILEVFQAGSQFFLSVRAMGFRKSAVTAPVGRTARSRTGRSCGECPDSSVLGI
jgi:hypothetical protein